MTDERFIQKVIAGVDKNFKKSEEQRDKELPALTIPYSKREYERIRRLLTEINNSCDKYRLQLLNNNYIKVHKKKSWKEKPKRR